MSSECPDSLCPKFSAFIPSHIKLVFFSLLCSRASSFHPPSWGLGKISFYFSIKFRLSFKKEMTTLRLHQHFYPSSLILEEPFPQLHLKASAQGRFERFNTQVRLCPA